MPNLHNDFDYSEQAVSGTATKNSTTNLDLKITSTKHYLNGGMIIYQNAVWGDWIEAQIVDIDGVTYPAGTVLKHYIKKRYLHPDENRSEVLVEYGGEIPQNMYLRLIYHSTGLVNDVSVAANYYLHELGS